MASNPFDQFDTAPVKATPLTGPRQPAPMDPLDRQIKEEQLRGEHLKNEKTAAEGGEDFQMLGDPNKAGPDYLATLKPADRAIVRAMAEGRAGIPTGYSMKSKRVQQLYAAAAQFDPTFDASNLPARIATRKAYTSGKQAQNITSFNTALGHLARMAKSAEALGNTGIPIVNSLRNGAFKASGYPEVDAFNTDRKAVVDELTRAFRGSGGNVHDVEAWERSISASQSPTQLRAVIAEASALLESRVQALEDGYNEGMKTTGQPLPMLNQHARDALAVLQSPDYKDHGYEAVAGALGGGGGRPSSGPIDPSGTGDIGAAGAHDPYQSQVSAIPPEQAAAWREWVGSNYKPGQVPDDQLAAAMAQKYQEITGRPLVNAADNAAFFNKTGKLSTETQYQPSGALKDQISEDQRKQALIASQNITDVRGNQSGEGVDSIVRAATNGLTFGGANKIVARVKSALGGGDYENNLARERAIDQYDTKNHFVGQLTGSALGVMGNEAGLARLARPLGIADRIPDALRPALGDAAYGSVSGAVTDDGGAGDKIKSALGGAGLASAGGMVGRGFTRGVGNVISPVAEAGVRRLNAAGVTMTPGQILGAGNGMVGRFVKGMEDRATSIPVVGDFINASRRTGVEDFNRKAIDDALEPIGEALPDGIAAGHDAISHAQQAVSDAYSAALAPLRAPVDGVLTGELRQIAQRASGLPDAQAQAFRGILASEVQPYWPRNTGVIEGTQLQAMKQGLDRQIASYRSGSPSDRRLADTLSEVRDSLMGLAHRAAPEDAAAFRAADQAHAMMSRVNDAAAKGKDGVFTPNQFRTAVTRRGYGTTTANLARGEANMQQLSTDASTILPSSIGDSGTYTRAIGIGALGAIGGGAGYATDGQQGAALGAGLLTAPYLPGGRQATQWALAGSRGRTLNSLGDFLREGAEVGPVSLNSRELIPRIALDPAATVGALGTPIALQYGGYGGQ
jgi:hypothetical protein